MRRVRILDEDPDLGDGLTAEEFEHARRFGVADLVELGRGVHDPVDVGTPDLLGLLVLEGVLIRTVHVAERRCGELIGPGSLLRPWDHFGDMSPMPFQVSWRVITPVRLALLDDRIVTVSARWPALMRGILGRSIERSHDLAFNVAIHCLQHVELRLLVLLWHMADRFGRVTPEGTVVPLKLSHGDLAELIGSQRPSVSSRLAVLSGRGQVLRRSDRTWLLRGAPPAEVRDMRARAQTVPDVAVSADSYGEPVVKARST